MVDPAFGSQNERPGAASDQFSFSISDAGSSVAAAKINSRDNTGRIWSNVGISGGLKLDDNSDRIRPGNNYFAQETNVSSQPTQIHHVAEAKYQLVNPVFVTHKEATLASSVQFIPTSGSNADGIGHNVSNFVQDTAVAMCPTQEMIAVRYQMVGPVFIPENTQSISKQFVLPINNIENKMVQKNLTPVVDTMEPNGVCDASNHGSMPSSPAKESSLLRELHSAPSMDKSIEVMLQENSTECYRFVEQFASTMNSRSNVVNNTINAESEITRIAQQLAQSADDALRSVDGNSDRIKSRGDSGLAICVGSSNMNNSVDNNDVEITSSHDSEETK